MKASTIVCALLAAALLIQAASAASCAVKGMVSGKEEKPGKGKFQGSLCWDGLVTPATSIEITWTASAVTNYRASVIGNYSNLSPADVQLGVLSPPVRYVKTLSGTITADDLVKAGVFPRKLFLAKLFCSSDAGVGIVAANSDGAESVVAKARIVLSKAAMEKCASMP